MWDDTYGEAYSAISEMNLMEDEADESLVIELSKRREVAVLLYILI